MTSLLIPKRLPLILSSHVVRFCSYPVLKKMKQNPLMNFPTFNASWNIKPHKFHTWPVLYSDEAAIEVEESTSEDNGETKKKAASDPSKDRTKVIPPEVSIRYMKSEAYKTTYGDEPVWVKYRRNFKGQFTPRNTRKTCIRAGVISTGNPCPICRDEYLVLDYTNVDLLKQFICPETGQIYSSQITHICQKRLFQLEVAVTKAKLYGLLKYEVPFRKFNYNEYYTQKQ